MTKIKYSVLLMLIAANISSAGTGALSIKVTALDAIVKRGSRIMVRVTTTNTSDHEITYHDTSRDCDYSVTVLTGAGASALETESKRGLVCSSSELRITGKDIVVTLKPGESNDERLELTHLYDMSIPGEYTVNVERTFAGIGRLRSNSTKVKVAE